MDSVPCGVRAVTISVGESRMLRATVLKVLERTLDEIARNNRIMSGSEKVFRALEPEQLYAMCANSFLGWEQVEVIMTLVWKPSWNLWLCVRILQECCLACATTVTVGLVGI